MKAPVSIPIDWSNELDYQRLISVPEVRDRIASAAGMHRKGISGEELLEAFDTLVPMGVSMEKVAALAQPIYSRLGINTGKSRCRQLNMPPGCALVGVLCAMAKQGNELQEVSQAEDCCILVAKIPSSIYSFSGDLCVTVRRDAASTWMEAKTKIPGQMYDWVKSQRLLENLFETIPAFAA